MFLVQFGGYQRCILPHPVNLADSHKLTITTPLGNYKYLYLPMGLATSSGYFQKLMNEVFSGLPTVFVHLDDIIIMSPDLNDHRKLLCLVFERLQQHGLVVNDAKCVFAAKQLSFLDHLVSAEGIKPTKKLQSNNGLCLPANQETVKTISWHDSILL